MMVARLGKLGDITTSIAQAIYQMEGSGPNTIATRNNNPGNLRSGTGQTGSASGYAVFPDMATGWNALYHQINLNIAKGLNLYEFFGGKTGVYAGYAPSADSNDPVNYANFVASQTGLDPSVPLNQVTSGGSGTGVTVDSSLFPTTDYSGLTDTTTAGLFGMDNTTTLILLAAAAGIALIVGVSR
jgi:hypothetical protein